MSDYLSSTTDNGKKQDELISLDSYSKNTELLDCHRSSLDCSGQEAAVNSKPISGDAPREDTESDVILCSQSIKKEAKNEDIDIKTNVDITKAFINNLLESSLKRLAALETCPASSGDVQLFDCSDCDYKAVTQFGLRKHIRENHRNPSHFYNCSNCEYKTKNKFNLRTHIKYHHSNNIEWHKCNLCDYKSKYKAALERHVLLKHDEDAKWLCCQVCEYKTKDEYSFKRHVIRHNPRSHQCQFCDYIGKDKYYLKLHVSLKHDENCAWYQCSFCDYKTKTKRLLTQHFKVKHDENAEWYQCALCDYKTKLKGSLTEHTNWKHNKWHKWHQCQLCDYKTKFKNYLDLHMECKHKEDCKTKVKVIDLVEELGDKCTSSLEVKQEYVNSEDAGIDTEEDNTLLQTEKTDGSTARGDSSQSTVDGVDMQIAVDPEDFEYIVDCGNDLKEDYASDSIFRDENISGDANTKSDTCSENVVNGNNDLQARPASYKHNVTRNKPSKMHIKVKSTAYKTNDSNDLKGYAGRQYRCLFCDYIASTKKVVNQHAKEKHAEKVKWHQCTLCDYKTDLKRFLDQHLKYKHDKNVEWFQCKFCDYTTKYKYYLTKHVKCKHREKCDRNEVFQCAHCGFKTHLKHYLSRHFKQRSH